MRRQSKIPIGVFTAILMVLAAGPCIIFLFPSGSKSVVEDFYEYESEAEFGKSWDLLSSEMKQRFPNQADYVQNRSHVFLRHMEVETFQYDVGRSKKVKNWSLDKVGRQHKTAYEIPVTQVFNSRFGVFTLEQNCYVVREKGEWRLLWDYRFE
ncbi:hypothetical protein Q8G35_03485 [Peribacillus simplex]|uniref:DUF4878 domain-containing protein n=2 Tax=Peribacillus TaxID=2675229 RepID=A0AA90P736_9BACI|nr:MULTISPECIES: hypothetical protein [Peribacillus]MDP1417468.1 hypothetical protein [Peribacillus simplex]MDP1450123.1 hypothetical protein [Peribacillus frigoritolerans]